MFSIQIILSLAALAAVCYAGCLTHALRLARRRTAVLEETSEIAGERLDALEARLVESIALHQAALARIDGLMLRQTRLEKAAQRPEFIEAIDRSRRGAEIRELESTCGLNLGEARLIRTLYGRDERTAADA